MSLFRRLVLLVVALWLPVQAVAGVAMPLCRGGHESAATHEVPDHPAASGHAHHAGDHGASTEDRSGTDPLVCDHCGFCHLASAAMLPGCEPATPPERAHALVASSTWAPHARCLAPDFRPPIAAA